MESVLPPSLLAEPDRAAAVLRFCEEIIDSVAKLVPAVKPQSAYFEQLGPVGQAVQYAVCRYAQSKGLYVILDAKRGDIGTTAEAYAEAFLGSEYFADSITVNPYLGTDGITPFVKLAKESDKSVFALVKTSNASSSELQDLITDGGTPVYMKLAERLATSYPADTLGFVAGATQASQLRELRAKFPETFFLIPGYGAQGGTASDIALAKDANGGGYIVNSSRGIIGAWKKAGTPENYGKAAREAVLAMKRDLA
jgi:orotidine-5'-phosphate decarboxylase